MKFVGNKLLLKQGETFNFSGAVLNKRNATPIETLGLTVRSQIRRCNAERDLIADLECAWLDPAAAVVSIHYSGDSASWPPGNALWDVQLIDQSGQVRITDSVELVIERHVTRNAAEGGNGTPGL